jgi:UDP-N-acetylglucosamine 1-carboxyvinyltransferase
MAREHLEIVGGRPLFGTVTASGAKNAALPIMAAALLAEGVVELDNVPRVADVATQSRVLAALGVHVEWIGAHRLRLFTVSHRPQAAPAELVHSMRASFCVLGPLLARRGRARVPLPGGCRIGPRPVDLHLRGLTALGADVRVVSGCVVARCGGLRGARVDMAGSRGPSVTGTANVLCAAVLARGETVIRGAAREPEIVDLGHFLQGMGARIEGLGTDCLRVQGVAGLAGGRHRLLPDRIEAGTFLLAGAMSGGKVEVREGRAEHLEAVLDALEQAGCDVSVGTAGTCVAGPSRPQAVPLVARPYPGLPTDLQPLFCALLSIGRGRSLVCDEVFGERWSHLHGLGCMGARYEPVAGGVRIEGVDGLRGADVVACDLRGGAALVLAALAAAGTTRVYGLRHIDRGYEGLEAKLAALGAEAVRRPLKRENRCEPAGFGLFSNRAYLFSHL